MHFRPSKRARLRLLATAATALPLLAAALALTRGAEFVPLRFESERIVMTVLDGAVIVEGRYVYRWEGERSASVLLHAPVPVDEAHPRPERIRITCDGLPLPSLRLGDGAWFLIPVAPREDTVVNLRYEQARLDDTFTYVLTTTRSWRRPIAHAELVVVAPRLASLQASLPLRHEGGGVWRGSFHHFWPAEDLRVRLLPGGGP